MKKSHITKKHVIHCKSKSEFNRIIKMFDIDDEYINWDIYEKDTVLFPLYHQYGSIYGYAKENDYIVIESEKLIS